MNTLVLGRELTDKQWELVAAILPADPVRPDRYGPHQTVHRRFQNWVRTGVIKKSS